MSPRRRQTGTRCQTWKCFPAARHISSRLIHTSITEGQDCAASPLSDLYGTAIEGGKLDVFSSDSPRNSYPAGQHDDHDNISVVLSTLETCFSPEFSPGTTCSQQNILSRQPEMEKGTGVVEDAGSTILFDSGTSVVGCDESSWPTSNSAPQSTSVVGADSVVNESADTSDTTRVANRPVIDEEENQPMAEDLLVAEDWLDATHALMLQQADAKTGSLAYGS